MTGMMRYQICRCYYSGQEGRWLAECSVWRDFEKTENWTNRNLVKFNKEKCKVSHLESSSPMCQYRLGARNPAGRPWVLD